jgi:hypothetical protein
MSAAGPEEKRRGNATMDNTDQPDRKPPSILAPDVDRMRSSEALSALRERTRWVLWRPILRKDRWTKPLFQTNGKFAKSDDPATWSTFEECAAAIGETFPGLGYVMGPGDAAFDLDDVRNPETGEILHWAEVVIDRAGSYAEISPSGRGIRIIGTGVGPDLQVKLKIPGADASCELYRGESHRYYTTTGLQLEGTADRLASLDEVMDAVHQELTAAPSVVLQFPQRPSRGRPSRADLARRRVEETVRDGRYEDFGQDRSKAVWFVVCEMIRNGSTDQQIREVISDPTNKISEHVLDQPKPEQYADRQIANARRSIEDDRQSLMRRLGAFVAYRPSHDYIFALNGAHWPGASVDDCVGPLPASMTPTGRASHWLNANRAVDDATWAPGEDKIIEDRLINGGGWIDAPGYRMWNLYRPPSIELRPGDPSPWVDHLVRLYGEEGARRIQMYFAHRVQHPGRKINFGLMMGGAPGIGKDTLIEALFQAVGAGNFKEASPRELLGPWTHYGQAVVLRISEAADLGEFDRFKFYERCKTLMASPPAVLEVNEKHVKQYYVPNVVGVIITTNHRTSGLYLPENDRRHEIYWTDVTREDLPSDYLDRLWQWYYGGGFGVVAHHLATFDLSEFNEKAPPPKTRAFLEIASTSDAPENAELEDALDSLGRPDALTIDDLLGCVVSEDFRSFLSDRKSARQVGHRLEEVGYRRQLQPGVVGGKWVINGKRRVLYVRRELKDNEAVTACRSKCGQAGTRGEDVI